MDSLHFCLLSPSFTLLLPVTLRDGCKRGGGSLSCENPGIFESAGSAACAGPPSPPSRVRKGTGSQSVVVCVGKYPGGQSQQPVL